MAAAGKAAALGPLDENMEEVSPAKPQPACHCQLLSARFTLLTPALPAACLGWHAATCDPMSWLLPSVQDDEELEEDDDEDDGGLSALLAKAGIK